MDTIGIYNTEIELLRHLIKGFKDDLEEITDCLNKNLSYIDRVITKMKLMGDDKLPSPNKSNFEF